MNNSDKNSDTDKPSDILNANVKDQPRSEAELAASVCSAWVGIGAGFRDDENRTIHIDICGSKYLVPFDHFPALVTQIVSQGLLTGLLSWDYLQQILEQHKEVKNLNRMYDPVPLTVLPSNQQSNISPDQNQ